eukprot:g15169.t1
MNPDVHPVSSPSARRYIVNAVHDLLDRMRGHDFDLSSHSEDEEEEDEEDDNQDDPFSERSDDLTQSHDDNDDDDGNTAGGLNEAFSGDSNAATAGAGNTSRAAASNSRPLPPRREVGSPSRPLSNSRPLLLRREVGSPCREAPSSSRPLSRRREVGSSSREALTNNRPRREASNNTEVGNHHYPLLIPSSNGSSTTSSYSFRTTRTVTRSNLKQCTELLNQLANAMKVSSTTSGAYAGALHSPETNLHYKNDPAMFVSKIAEALKLVGMGSLDLESDRQMQQMRTVHALDDFHEDSAGECYEADDPDLAAFSGAAVAAATPSDDTADGHRRARGDTPYGRRRDMTSPSGHRETLTDARRRGNVGNDRSRFHDRAPQLRSRLTQSNSAAPAGATARDTAAAMGDENQLFYESNQTKLALRLAALTAATEDAPPQDDPAIEQGTPNAGGEDA